MITLRRRLLYEAVLQFKTILNAKGNTYYFISEYILDATSTQIGISFHAEYSYTCDYLNHYGDSANDYAGSNVREYLNGLTVKNGYYDDSANKQ